MDSPYFTTSGDYCGEFKFEGTPFRINIPGHTSMA